jgi:hypothetical protein
MRNTGGVPSWREDYKAMHISAEIVGKGSAETPVKNDLTNIFTGKNGETATVTFCGNGADQ